MAANSEICNFCYTCVMVIPLDSIHIELSSVTFFRNKTMIMCLCFGLAFGKTRSLKLHHDVENPMLEGYIMGFALLIEQF